MSNVKQFAIVAVLPFDLGSSWAMTATPDPARVEAAKTVRACLGITLEPFVNATLTWDLKSRQMKPNEFGGQTAMVRGCFQGREAIGWGWFDALRSAIGAIGGTVETWKIVDVEA